MIFFVFVFGAGFQPKTSFMYLTLQDDGKIDEISISKPKKQYLNLIFFLFFRDIMPAVRKNKEQAKTNAAYNIVMGADMNEDEMIAANRRNADQMSNVVDIR